MGCFLACFGFQKGRKKRRPPTNKVAICESDQIALSYEPLDSSRISTCISDEKPELQDLKSSGGLKKQPWVKIRKKVSFNLNVQSYEPVPGDQTYLENDENSKIEKNNQEAENETDVTSLSGNESTMLNSVCYPQNYRYQSFRDGYDEDEDDDYMYGDSDMEDKGSDQDCNVFKSCEFEGNTIDRSQQVHSVLKPVENLTQWRAAKAKAVTIPKQQMENKATTSEQLQPLPLVPISSNPCSTRSPSKLGMKQHSSDPLMKENLVHSSLSDWLV